MVGLGGWAVCATSATIDALSTRQQGIQAPRLCRRIGETQTRLLPQAPKSPGLVFHSIPSSLSLSLSLPLFLFPTFSSFLLSHCVIPPILCFYLPYSCILSLLNSFLVFGSSLVRIFLTSSFYQAPVRLLRLGRPPLSSLRISQSRFGLHSYSRTRRIPRYRLATMSASEDDTPLIKSNGRSGK